MPSERYARLDEPAIRWLDQSGRFTVGPIKELDGAIFEFEGIEHPNGRLAVQMLTQSGIAKTTFQSLRILDNGCGSASISSAIQQARAAHTTSKGSLTPPWTTRPCQIVAGVSSTDIRIFSKEELQDTAKRRGWVDQTIENIDMQSLRFPSRSFTHVFTNLSLLFCQDDDAAVKEVFRVLKPSGVAAFSAWQEMGWQPKKDDNANAISQATLGDPCLLFPSSGWRHPTYAQNKLRKHGFDDIRITQCVMDTYPMDILGTVRASFKDVVSRLVRLSVKKLWNDGNGETDGNADFEDLVQQMVSSYEGVEFGGELSLWIIVAKRPPQAMPGTPTREQSGFRWS